MSSQVLLRAANSSNCASQHHHWWIGKLALSEEESHELGVHHLSVQLDAVNPIVDLSDGSS